MLSLRVPAIRLVTAVAAVLSFAGGRPAAQAPAAANDRASVDRVLDELDAVMTTRETAIAPDGSSVAWVVDVPPMQGGGSAVFVRVLGGRLDGKSISNPGAVRRVTTVPARRGSSDRGIAWSRDGRSLAFLSDAETPGQPQLYLLTDGAGAPKRLTSVKGQLDHPLFSPDGKQISALYVAGSSQATGALVAYKPDEGVVGETIEEQRIAVIPTAGGGIREVSPADMFVYDYDWSPDGQSFAAEAVKGSGTDNYWTAELYAIKASTGAARSIWKPPLQIACPRWSPDGTSIAVIHGLMSDEGSTGGDVYVVPADGGAPRDLTPNLEGSARSLDWRADGSLVVNEWAGDKSALVSLSLAGGTPRTLLSERANYTSVSIARESRMAMAVQSFARAPEIALVDGGAPILLTATNAAVMPRWGDPTSLYWKSDPFPSVQGWLVCPAESNPATRYPLVVSVHGGPSSAYTAAWPTRWNAVLPSQGYCVLMPNPRGSYGRGEAFTQANVKDFGYGDLKDILAGVDAAVGTGRVDPNRVGLIGWSYGGYMTMWAVTQTTRFKAAVAGAGIASWQSYYGQNKIDKWMIPFFGASVYDDPDVYARSSPITFIKKTKTPTLVLHGDRDSEVPTPQGYEFWRALKSLGVPTELVIYPNEGHAIAQPAHVHDIERRLVAWFDRYLR